MAHAVVGTIQNPATHLRTALDGLETASVAPSAASLEALLLQLDATEAALAELEAQGADLRAERVRWENLTRRLASRPQLIANAARALPGGLPGLRARLQRTPESAPWWRADLVYARRRRRLSLEILAIVVGIPLILIGIYLGASWLFPPDPAAVALLQAETAVDRAVAQGDAAAALAAAEDAYATHPQERTLAAWVAVLAQMAGQSHRAAEMEQEAEVLFGDDQLGLWLTWSEQHARVGNSKAALAWAQRTVDAYPESALAWFSLARAATMEDDRALALQSLEKVSALARESNPELAVNAQILYAELLQRPPNSAALEAGDALPPSRIAP